MATLTTDEIREHIETALGDDALQRLLDAAEEQIVERAGATGSRTDIAAGGGRFVTLRRQADSITSVVEVDRLGDTTTLAADDYRLYPGGTLLERLATGTNPRSTWAYEVRTTYVPVNTDAIRAKVQIDLVELALNRASGVAEEQIGEWRQVFTTQNSAWNLADERDAILSQLAVPRGMVVIG